MTVKRSEYVASAVTPSQYPEACYPEIALVGRSNVGKSSLINRLVNRRNLARTSSQPGKTQTINFYLINAAWYFVDLPGYGFARVSHNTREHWRTMIEKYLSQRSTIQQVWQLVDLRHPPTEQDQQMVQWLSHYRFPKLIIATKADKISKSQRVKNLGIIRNRLDVPETELISFSAESGEGKEKLLSEIEKILGYQEEVL
ncbi:YihA family ribosome biogenesis GTP-binding protein [Candidatus Formimonas warabiya]|uniref:Probable GTP-binding protein EngB n=1 Tax=Formimonas warabiya TaxID=1761012 RepID=A0A3G1L282_FORW1|nr:ribosome biogenesis GTP-binding protein YihA/YsxC [Candidatus Formimonas warabiya]ATW28575.1 YihA family ribosome biogenesis GTP-binding protein [Candidatus Formimonas warabiya]